MPHKGHLIVDWGKKADIEYPFEHGESYKISLCIEYQLGMHDIGIGRY